MLTRVFNSGNVTCLSGSYIHKYKKTNRPMQVFSPGWYIIYTKPRHEKKVFHRLTEIRIQSFLPTKKTLRSWHDRKKYVDEPLFPSYIFIYLKELRNYYDGMDTDGALYFVRTGKDIARVNDTVVNNIRLVS